MGGYSVTGISTDVSKIEDLKQLFNHSLKTWGKIDVWINNAGVSSGYRQLEQISNEEIKKIVDINLTGTLQACKIIIPYFKEQEKGILINMSEGVEMEIILLIWFHMLQLSLQ